MDQHTAKKLIDKTRDDYNLIADQFASTRRYNWGDVVAALDTFHLHKDAKVLDLGCGNGRVYELLKDKRIEYYGLDTSKELVKLAKQSIPKGHFIIGDLLKTPYKDNEFDLVICMATLHHIPSKSARIDALYEIYRVTKPGGNVLITIWYFWNKPFYIKQIFRNFWFQLRGKSILDPGDFSMPWRTGNGKTVTRRYFHAWRKWELSSALKKVNFINVKAVFFFKLNKKIGNNFIVTAQKPK